MSLSSQTPDRTYLPFRGVENDDKVFLPLNPDLKEIRCVILLPGSGDDPIECELVYTNIDKDSADRIPYVALSYCWGDVEDTVEIMLHSSSPNDACSQRQEPVHAPFRITRNLFIALQALRNANRQYLWIDALCINQQDPREKTHQVQLMGKIYSSADWVVAWLGPEDMHSRFLTRLWSKHLKPLIDGRPSVARLRTFEDILSGDPHPVWEIVVKDKKLRQLWLEYDKGTLSTSLPGSYTSAFLNALKAVFERPWWSRIWVVQEKKLRQLWLEYDKGTLRTSSPGSYTIAFLNALKAVFERPWWSRIWVVQEVLLASRRESGRNVEFRMGNDRLLWHEMRELLMILRGMPSRPKIGRTSEAQRVWSYLTISDLPGSFNEFYSFEIFDLIWLTVEFHASDPRDKLFALLLLAEDTKDCLWQEPLISPDYTKSAKTVFDDLVRWKPYLKGLEVYVEGIGLVILNGDSDWTKSR
jgi:hypothetical protein